MEFQAALDAHLAALHERDLDAAIASLAPSDHLTLILPNGVHMIGYDAVAEFFRTWFADPEWSMTAELLHTFETDRMAFALLVVDYHDLDPSGQPYQLNYYLSLTFVLSDNQWLLIHDQNTLVYEGR